MFNNYIQRNFSILLSFFLFFAISTNSLAAVTVPDVDPANADMMAKAKEGMDLFKANCTACHAVDKKLIGPALSDVWTRWGSEEHLIAWIKNSQSFLKTGDSYATKLFNDYNKSVMQAFPTLSDDQIKNILIYIKAKQNGIDPGAPAGGTADAGATAGVATAPAKSNNTLIISLLAIVLAILAGVLYGISTKLKNVVNEANGIVIAEEDQELIKKKRTKKIISAVVIVLALLLLFNIGQGAINLGRSQGYAPEQPIRFSHKLHVGQNKIDCQYCHTGVEKSRHASIPGTQICMNCHKYVSEGPKYGKEEIKKIYQYSGWDPDQASFTKAPKNIEWVKIHNLPDHVYFNHAQHVKVGKIECQTCHGKIEEMETVEQFAPLSMGWCINCHRETKVQFTDNNYYSVFEKYHDEIKKGERAGVTVQDIGGSECQKCHY